jgi:hypothetical protein
MDISQPVLKKRVIKKKNQSVSADTNVEIMSDEVTTDVEENISGEQVSFIPSSRIKNYISKEKLNKQLDIVISKLKESDESIDLSTVLTLEQQSALGSIIKQKEENKEEIVISTLAVEMLSKHKFKFSHTSFKVLSVFLDIMIEDLTLNVMEEVIKSKKSIINLKYAFGSNTTSPLYEVYSKLPTFVAEKENLTKDSNEEVVDEVAIDEQVEDDAPEEQLTRSINFEFYVRKICNKLKKSKEEYNKIKVSNNYQKFCSNLILEFLDRVAPMTSIVLEVMTTKTITNLVFETVIKLQLCDNLHCDSIINEIKKRLQ